MLPGILCSLFLYVYVTAGKGVSSANIIYIVTIVAICEISRYIIYKSRTWFKGWLRKLRRTLAVLISGIGAVSLIFIVSKAARNYLAFGDFKLGENYASNVYINNTQLTVGVVGSSVFYAVILFLFLFFIYETVYHFARLRHIEKQNDRLEKQKLQAELQQLKGIVNPHFLFNNLNSLSSLISENPPLAEAFLDELTKVFRYLLRNNNSELTTVAEELQFIHSYYHLLQTRYGRSISLNVNVPAHSQQDLLPPMTLQLLIENAVKHNRLQKDQPLEIGIFLQGTSLIVRNNLSKRERPVESTGIGLHSINSRYKLLNHPGLTITQDDKFFSVMIPLIESGHSLKPSQKQQEQISAME